MLRAATLTNITARSTVKRSAAAQLAAPIPLYELVIVARHNRLPQSVDVG
jgi:hypothetical protein